MLWKITRHVEKFTSLLNNRSACVDLSESQSDQDHGSNNASGRQRNYTSGAATGGNGQYSNVGEAQGQEVI